MAWRGRRRFVVYRENTKKVGVNLGGGAGGRLWISFGE